MSALTSRMGKQVFLTCGSLLLGLHRATLQCIRTMTCEYALCSFFVPGDRQVVIGTKVNSDFLDFGDFSTPYS